MKGEGQDGLAQHHLGKTGQKGGQIPADLKLNGMLGLSLT